MPLFVHHFPDKLWTGLCHGGKFVDPVEGFASIDKKGVRKALAGIHKRTGCDRQEASRRRGIIFGGFRNARRAASRCFQGLFRGSFQTVLPAQEIHANLGIESID